MLIVALIIATCSRRVGRLSVIDFKTRGRSCAFDERILRDRICNHGSNSNASANRFLEYDVHIHFIAAARDSRLESDGNYFRRSKSFKLVLAGCLALRSKVRNRAKVSSDGSSYSKSIFLGFVHRNLCVGTRISIVCNQIHPQNTHFSPICSLIHGTRFFSYFDRF